MERKVKLLVGGAGVVVLFLLFSVTTMGSTTEFVSPTDLEASDDYDGEYVKLEGRALDVTEDDGEITFDVIDPNATVPVVYDDERPETLSDGRRVVAEGRYDGSTLEAGDLTIRAHEGEHPENYSKGDRYEEYPGNASTGEMATAD